MCRATPCRTRSSKNGSATTPGWEALGVGSQQVAGERRAGHGRHHEAGEDHAVRDGLPARRQRGRPEEHEGVHGPLEQRLHRPEQRNLLVYGPGILGFSAIASCLLPLSGGPTRVSMLWQTWADVAAWQRAWPLPAGCRCAAAFRHVRLLLCRLPAAVARCTRCRRFEKLAARLAIASHHHAAP